jgi:hypothetical protein
LAGIVGTKRAPAVPLADIGGLGIVDAVQSSRPAPALRDQECAVASDTAPGGPPTPDPANLFTAAVPSFSSGVTIVTATEVAV